MSADAGDGADELTPAERLRTLELSGDPDARTIARSYKESPLTGGLQSSMRQIGRAGRGLGQVGRPTYSLATEADADEAEERVAEVRARRERERREREQHLHDFAAAADRRERLMLKMTRAIVVIAVASLLVSAAALVVAALAA